MPLYEFACRKCEHTFEQLVFNGEAVECPECRGRKVERLLSVPARPRVQGGASALPLACDPKAPPCGAPGCCRM